MTEFETERTMPAGADAVFAVVSDLERLTEWLPHEVRVRPTDDDPGSDPARGAKNHVTEVHARVEPRHTDAYGLVRVRSDQMRVEWGGGDSTDYAGYLQVMGDDPDRSSVLLHLSFLGDQPETHTDRAADDVRRGLDTGLDNLARMVAGRAR
ncbi:SRPBCC family protein [Pseudonocardia sp.]|uniref:SRPBCC family protein n=1 Tax=Pseudonocardia sp. TaxID=60912 RepID=UPI002620B790|nr:SRPBCC family protein [Pseudonocardia sp.]